MGKDDFPVQSLLNIDAFCHPVHQSPNVVANVDHNDGVFAERRSHIIQLVQMLKDLSLVCHPFRNHPNCQTNIRAGVSQMLVGDFVPVASFR